MASKAIAAVIAFAVLLSIASAQEYSIRANRGLNLRAEPNLNAPIADTVLSGSILQVVGEFNRWLKIDRGGRQVWLANWVNYSRIDSSEPSGSQQPTAPIDNCCYVDRQCQSDQEWVAGYWAYQNNQCPASPSSAPQTPAQPVGGAPATVDNCCFVDRQCQSDAQWEAGYWAYQRNQCAAPGQRQPVSPTASALTGVNNCCIIDDLNCVTDFEWRRGYWAFQVGHCAAPGQSQSTTPAQPAAGAPTTGGNCCNLGWNCPTEVERVQGLLGLSD